MRFLDVIDISASGLTAQRLRLDTIANNMPTLKLPEFKMKRTLSQAGSVFGGRTSRAQRAKALPTYWKKKWGLSMVKEIRSVSEMSNPSGGC